MKQLEITEIFDYGVVFDDGTIIDSKHDSECCESHYLSFRDITLDDVKGLLFDLTTDDFFEKVEDYGIRLKPTNGHPISIPGYGFNNGYYGHNIDLRIRKGNEVIKKYDVSDCQVTED